MVPGFRSCDFFVCQRVRLWLILRVFRDDSFFLFFFFFVLCIRFLQSSVKVELGLVDCEWIHMHMNISRQMDQVWNWSHVPVTSAER